jgi:hypothetical protein
MAKKRLKCYDHFPSLSINNHSEIMKELMNMFTCNILTQYFRSVCLKMKWPYPEGFNEGRYKKKSMLSGSPVTTAWRVLRLRMEEMASRYGG